MSRMLTPIRDGLESAAALRATGRFGQARYLYLDLLLRAGDEGDEAFAVRAEAARFALERGRYAEARRHLRAAAALRPDDAGIYYLWGCAWDRDPMGCDRRAARKYKKATTLNANDPISRAALGRAMVRLRETRSGVNVLRRAAAAAPTDPEVLEIVRDGLREADQAELALTIMKDAMFRKPTDRRLRHLWDRARYDVTSQTQERTRAEAGRSQGDGPALLPFVRLHATAKNEPAADPTILRVRRDAPEPTQPRLRAFRSY